MRQFLLDIRNVLVLLDERVVGLGVIRGRCVALVQVQVVHDCGRWVIVVRDVGLFLAADAVFRTGLDLHGVTGGLLIIGHELREGDELQRVDQLALLRGVGYDGVDHGRRGA